MAAFVIVCVFFGSCAIQIAGAFVAVLVVILGLMIHYWYITVAAVIVYLLMR